MSISVVLIVLATNYPLYVQSKTTVLFIARCGGRSKYCTIRRYGIRIPVG